MVYYVYTEALLMADSRVKNMMIATWGKENYALKEDEPTQESVLYNYPFGNVYNDGHICFGNIKENIIKKDKTILSNELENIRKKINKNLNLNIEIIKNV